MAEPGVFSYLAGAGAYLALAVAMATRWRGRLRAPLLLLACVVSVAWATLLAWHVPTESLSWGVVFLLEAARGSAWLVFLLRLLDGDSKGSHQVPPLLRYGVNGLWLGALLLGVTGSLLELTGLTFVGAGLIYILGAFLLALIGLVLVEQLYRNAEPDRRWGIKYLCLGLGGVFVFDLYLYANGLLFRQIDATIWNARGAAHALLVPLLAIAVKRHRSTGVTLFFSRKMALYTSSLLGTGLYLLAMAAGGYYIRIYGGAWGPVVQVIFLVGGLILLATMLFSGQARARLSVFLSKHFYNYKFEYRDEWLRLTRTLSTPSDTRSLHESAVLAIAQVMESHAGLLWLRQGDEGYAAVANLNMPLPGEAFEPVGGELHRFFVDREWIIDLDEYSVDPDAYGGLRLPAWMELIDGPWLVVPLMQGDDMLGFILLAESRARRRLTFEDHDLLKAIGRQVAGYLAQHTAAEALAEARQFQGYNRLTAFIMHDLKNLIAQQSLVVRNAAKHKDNPAFIDDAIATVENSVQRMNRLLAQLKQGETPGVARAVSLETVCSDAVGQCHHRQPVPELEVRDTGLYAKVAPGQFSMILGHVIRNAQDATDAAGRISVCLERVGDVAHIVVRDTGAGMDAGFVRERLFRPFDSTKGSQGMGIGAYQAREFVRAAGGEVTVSSVPDQGTEFIIRLPLVEPKSRSRPERASGVQV